MLATLLAKWQALSSLIHTNSAKNSSCFKPRHSPEDCVPRLKGAAGWAVVPKVAAVVAAAAGAAPKVNPVGAACRVAVLAAPMLKPVVPAWVVVPLAKVKPPVVPD